MSQQLFPPISIPNFHMPIKLSVDHRPPDRDRPFLTGDGLPKQGVVKRLAVDAHTPLHSWLLDTANNDWGNKQRTNRCFCSDFLGRRRRRRGGDGRPRQAGRCAKACSPVSVCPSSPRLSGLPRRFWHKSSNHFTTSLALSRATRTPPPRSHLNEVVAFPSRLQCSFPRETRCCGHRDRKASRAPPPSLAASCIFCPFFSPAAALDRGQAPFGLTG